MTAALLLSLVSLSQQLTALLLQYKPLMNQCCEHFKSSHTNQGRRYVALRVKNVRSAPFLNSGIWEITPENLQTSNRESLVLLTHSLPSQHYQICDLLIRAKDLLFFD